MIVTKLQGGLGNQMFQYAAAMQLLKKGEKIYLDCTFLEKGNFDTPFFTARIYELGVFDHLLISKAKSWQLNLLTGQSRFFRFLRYVLNQQVTTIRQKENEFVCFERTGKEKHFYLDGYFQSEKYFENHREKILQHFRFPCLDVHNISLQKRIERSVNAVGLHIRRGDYIKPAILEVHGSIPLTYYNKALKMLKEKHLVLTLFVFSDDISWVKENFDSGISAVHFVDNNQGTDTWKDMALMTSCKHHVIANSSFSWWGAWLSGKNGDVMAPYQWFSPAKLSFNINDFIPSNWTTVHYD